MVYIAALSPISVNENVRGDLMPTLFAVYKLKSDQKDTDYDDYLNKTKIPGIREHHGVRHLTLGK